MKRFRFSIGSLLLFFLRRRRRRRPSCLTTPGTRRLRADPAVVDDLGAARRPPHRP